MDIQLPHIQIHPVTSQLLSALFTVHVKCYITGVWNALSHTSLPLSDWSHFLPKGKIVFLSLFSRALVLLLISVFSLFLSCGYVPRV